MCVSARDRLHTYPRLCLCKNSHNHVIWVENLFKQILLTPDGVRTSLAPLVFNVFIEAGYGGAFNSLCNGALGACNCSDGVNWGRRMFSWTLEEYNFPLTFPRGGKHCVLLTSSGMVECSCNLLWDDRFTSSSFDAFIQLKHVKPMETLKGQDDGRGNYFAMLLCSLENICFRSLLWWK